MRRHRTETGRIVERACPRSLDHGLGVYNLIEIMATNATYDDLDDHTRLLAGALLLGLNLGHTKSNHGLDLTLAFRERDL